MANLTMTKLKALLVPAAAGLTVLAAAAIPAPAPAAEVSPALKTVIDAANKEGNLKLFLHPGAWGDGRGIQRIEAGMNKMFGTKIKVQYASGPAMGAIGNQLLAEFKANRPASTDVYFGNGPYAIQLVDAGMLHAVEWTALLPGRITDKIVEEKGMAIRSGNNVRQIAYNTNILPKPPETLDGWLAPSLKGKLATTPYAAGFIEMAGLPGWNADKLLAYSKALSEQVSGLIGCGDEHRVASGEFAALIFVCGSDADVLREKGAPIALVTPRDFVSVSYFYLMVPKHATNPNAAKLLITYLMTEEGQKITWETERRDLHSFPGSQSGKEVDAAVAKATTPVLWRDIAWMRANSGGQEVLAEIIKTFRSKGGSGR
jgi:ABC-type Fe3+ transport system substrate-binding protein